MNAPSAIPSQTCWNATVRFGVGSILEREKKCSARERFVGRFTTLITLPFQSGAIPCTFGVVERQIPIPAHQQETAGRSADREVIYEMSYVDGEEVSRFVEKQSPPPAVIARL